MPNLFDALWDALLILAAIIALVLAVHCICCSERNERAAYYEGRFGVDAATALQLAAEEVR